MHLHRLNFNWKLDVYAPETIGTIIFQGRVILIDEAGMFVRWTQKHSSRLTAKLYFSRWAYKRPRNFGSISVRGKILFLKNLRPNLGPFKLAEGAGGSTSLSEASGSGRWPLIPI
jgi:hypothetical protein